MVPPPAEELVPAVCSALEDLQQYPAPALPSPPETPRRASVAVIMRVQPNPSHLPTSSEPLVSSISEFFRQPWTQHGEIEILFIKRAARKGDRWTAHVACPGGKRDPEDASDYDAAVRETLEEVGLDLRQEGVISAGHLPDRVVTTSWGTVPLMVLCPFVFLLTSPNPPPLCLQPTEVASAHWVPLRTLLAPEFRTVAQSDVTDRLAQRYTGWVGKVVRYGLRLSLGRMEYAAIRLWPTLSVYSSFGNDFLKEPASGNFDNSLILWGLTLGIVEDFMDMLPPVGGALGLWNWPTFTAWDVRAVVSVLTNSVRKRNFEIAKKEAVETIMLKENGEPKDTELAKMEDSVVDLGEEMGESTVLVKRPRALSEPRKFELKARGERERLSSVNTLLQGYFPLVRKAVWITLVGRVVIGGAVITAMLWKVKNRFR
ncbi:NUDIX family hydrolase [Pyronema omphalodes]|nr:NUDIX family hydrolase [Pyronema omphalodes]